MQQNNFPLTRQPSTPRAPIPSPALLALQDQGFELPSSRRPSAQSLIPPDQRLRVSPLSISSSTSDLDKPLPLEPHEKSRRASSVYSADTTVTKIVGLYTSKSQGSLKSLTAGGETILESEDELDQDEPPPPTFHQPKAYRDTIVPLLQHQNDSDDLKLSPMLTPSSFASSLPKLSALSASRNSLQTTPDGMRGSLKDMSTLKLDDCSDSGTCLVNEDKSAPIHQEFENKRTQTGVSTPLSPESSAQHVSPISNERQESWYDQPISPISPTESEETQSIEEAARSSTSISQSQNSIDHQRQLAYDSLSLPSPLTSPRIQPVVSSLEEFLPGPICATVTDIPDRSLIPTPLNLSRSPSRSPQDLTKTSSQIQKQDEAENPVPKPVFSPKLLPSHGAPAQHKPSVASVTTVWPAPPIFRSPESIPSPPSERLTIQPTFGKTLKKKVKAKFIKRKQKKAKQLECPWSTGRGSLASNSKMSYESRKIMEFATLKYPAMAETFFTKRDDERPPSPIGSRQMSISDSSITSGPGPAVPSSPMQPVHYTDTGASVLAPFSSQIVQSRDCSSQRTSYRTLGTKNPEKKARDKRKTEDMAARKAAALENISGQERVARPDNAGVFPSISHQHAQRSRWSGHSSIDRARRQRDMDEGNISSKGKQMKRIFRTSEGRRKEKLKDSITVVGHGRPLSYHSANGGDAKRDSESFF